MELSPARFGLDLSPATTVYLTLSLCKLGFLCEYTHQTLLRHRPWWEPCSEPESGEVRADVTVNHWACVGSFSFFFLLHSQNHLSGPDNVLFVCEAGMLCWGQQTGGVWHKRRLRLPAAGGDCNNHRFHVAPVTELQWLSRVHWHYLQTHCSLNIDRKLLHMLI